MRRMTKWMSAVLSFGLCLFVGFTQTAAQAAELPGATVADSGGTTSMREVMAATGSSLVIPGVVRLREVSRCSCVDAVASNAYPPPFT